MSDYYQDMIDEIRSLLENGELEDASYLLRKELSMPYIPSDVEQELVRLQKDLSFRRSEAKEATELSLETILKRLNSKDPQMQLAAANALCERNLRSLTEQLQVYFDTDPVPEAAALLIEAIAEQEVPEEFVIQKEGMEYTFWGDCVVPVEKSEGFRIAFAKLNDRFVKDPATLQLARMILVHKAYLNLPLSYEEDEADLLVEECASEVEQLMMAEVEEAD